MTQYQQPMVPAEKKANGLGIAATILGILALLFSIIPMCGLIPAIALAIAGGILALVGFFAAISDKRTSIAFPLVGGALCIIAVIVGIVMTAGSAAAIKQAADRAAAQQRANMATHPPTAP